MQLLGLENVKLLDTIHMTIRIDSKAKEGIADDLKYQMVKSPQCVEDAKKVLASSSAKSPKIVNVTFMVRDFDEEASHGPYHNGKHWRLGDTQIFTV